MLVQLAIFFTSVSVHYETHKFINITSYELRYILIFRTRLIKIRRHSAVREAKHRMSKFELLERFMKSFVGNGLHLTIREGDERLLVHTIEVMEKVDESCPVRGISVGDYFLHLVATNEKGEEASMVCDWSEELLQNLLENYESAKEANHSEIVMVKDPLAQDPNKWLIMWGNWQERVQTQADAAPIKYIT
jgi:hypothetical protein